MVEPAQAVGAACRQETRSMAQVSLCVGSLVSRATPRFTRKCHISRTPLIHATMPHSLTTPVHAAIPQIAPTADSRGNAAFTYDAGSPCNAAYHKYRRFMPQCRVHERCRLTRQCCKLRATPVRTFMLHIADIAGARRNIANRERRRFTLQCRISQVPPFQAAMPDIANASGLRVGA